MAIKKFELVAVSPNDAESLVRHVDYPAMQDGPLYRLMFPRVTSESERESIIQLFIDGLKKAIQEEPGHFCQIRTSDGTPVAFSGWTLDQAHPAPEPVHPPQPQGKRMLLPACLNVRAWQRASDDLRAERRRILAGFQNICRLTFVMVNPVYQRQGLGSSLMRLFCEEVDRQQRLAFVLASPAGVPLYAKFGFEVVGTVLTPEGTLKSMLRQPQDPVQQPPQPVPS